MPAQWLVIQLDEGADHGTAKLLTSADGAQEYIAATVASGVPKENLLLFSPGTSVDFSVAYQPIVRIAGASSAPAAVSEHDSPEPVPARDVEAQGTQNGVRLSSMFKSD